MTSILVIEDEPRIASFLTRGLRAAGFVPTVVGTGGDAVADLVASSPDLVLLDLGLPDVDGHDLLAHLRQHHPGVPVVVLTARTSARDTIAALEGGAVDYVTKPFRFDELVARIRLRLGARPQDDVDDSELTLGDVHLDLAARICRRAGTVVELSPREFDLAVAFARHAGRALSRDQLRRQAWGEDESGGSNVVDVHVASLRRKLGADVVTTVRGIGYRA
ncbi:response regulator transcription factor [Aeromicrobium sp. Leaf350]|uniref:response regulator transcription factor n=1 Tax=Aeromicrobium sp. Leaf350 TaxID=2876565 RepID=UPI001E350F77|nr:response regulator transcription factor [Aeromicrobium sp. Leaf350]